MTTERKIIVYIATSADGYIARPDGGVDWLDRPHTAGDYGMGTFMKSIDTVLWGGQTFRMAGGRSGRGFGTKIKNYVFTHRPPSEPMRGIEFVNEPIETFATRLRATPGKDVWMMGGSGIIASFLDAGEIDEFIIHVIPTFIGEGIPLVQPRHRNVPLTLVSTQKFRDGVVRLQYAVARTKPPGRMSPRARA
jgi:dihydrofolate reductase